MSLKRATKGSQEPKLVWWPVNIQEPKDGGRFTVHAVKVQYEILPETVKDEAAAAGDPNFLTQVVRDWKDFQEDDNSQIPFTPEALADFCELSWVKSALIQTYFVAANGGRRKNS